MKVKCMFCGREFEDRKRLFNICDECAEKIKNWLADGVEEVIKR